MTHPARGEIRGVFARRKGEAVSFEGELYIVVVVKLASPRHLVTTTR